MIFLMLQPVSYSVGNTGKDGIVCNFFQFLRLLGKGQLFCLIQSTDFLTCNPQRIVASPFPRNFESQRSVTWLQIFPLFLSMYLKCIISGPHASGDAWNITWDFDKLHLVGTTSLLLDPDPHPRPKSLGWDPGYQRAPTLPQRPVYSKESTLGPPLANSTDPGGWGPLRNAITLPEIRFSPKCLAQNWREGEAGPGIGKRP